ncbi:MAG: hypothetical protein FJ319_09615 [SAR202 cluster bacterium]|nr:hypothetical protein [SAR202 cluster bacterium]
MKISLKKLILRIIIGIVAFVSACTTGLFGWVAVDTKTSADAANEFLLKLAERRLDEAYAGTSADFRASQTYPQFERTLELIGLPLTFQMDPWRDRTLEQDYISRIRGEVTDLGGTDVPFTARMVKEGGQWKVWSFTDSNRLDVGAGAWFQQLPYIEEMVAMSQETIKDFRLAVESGDFTEFHATMSRALTIGINAERFTQSYKEYIEAAPDLTGIEELEPVLLYNPTISETTIGFTGGVEGQEGVAIDDVFVMEGYFPTEPLPVPFMFRYHYEHPNWYLVQFKVEQPTIRYLSPQNCLQWLLRQGDKNLDQCYDQRIYEDMFQGTRR